MPRTRIRHLHPADVFVLTLIFFGSAIYSSTLAYLDLQAAGAAAPADLGLDGTAAWYGIATELVLLALSAAYLYWRRFDFRSLNFRFNRYTLPKTAACILLAGLAASAFEYGQYLLRPELYPAAEETGAESWFAHWSAPFFLFALLNGFYEELFFVGLLFAVPRKHLVWVLPFSLLVRFAFHTYQGTAAALTITTLGAVFIVLRLKYKELPPFMLAHSFFDLFGLTWLLSLAAYGFQAA